MSVAGPLPISGEFAPPPPPPRFIMEPPIRLSRLLLGLALGVSFFDLCFWAVNAPGLSIALFFVALATVILGNREGAGQSRATNVLLVLLAGAVYATLVETGLTNVIVLLVLTCALAGHTYFTRADSLWGRGLSQLIALIMAPGRVFWLAARLLEATFREGRSSLRGLLGLVLLSLPALVLAVVFGSLLATGNAVFGSWAGSFFDWLGNELAQYLNAGRIILWFLAAFAMLPLLRPASVSDWWWRWTERLPRLPDLVPARGAAFSSALVLIVLNVLFLIANFADAMFLWTGDTKLPTGLTYSGYVHGGVNALTITVILSAVILTVIFQQSLQVAGRRELKALALLWIAQNLFLLTSVALRLKLYIEAYDMTVERLGVIIFLVLVAAGFALLTIKIWQNRSLSWLIGACALAAFSTLYTTQFLNLAGWAADYNVTCCEINPSRELDSAYLGGLGPAAWPALHRAFLDNSKYNVETLNALNAARTNENANPQTKFDAKHWREFSLRAWTNRSALEEKPNN